MTTPAGAADDQSDQLRQALRGALGSFLTGVTVVTTVDEQGWPRGITANSFTSVSLDPPLVLVCVDQRSASYDAFTRGRGYAINILGHEHQAIAEVFASKRTDKFASVATTTSALGNPVLSEAITWLDCRTTDVHVIGDHAVLIGHVESFGGSGGQPLGFHRGRFLTFTPAVTLPSRGEVDVTWILQDGQERVALREHPDGGLVLPGAQMPARDLTDDGLAAAAERCIGAPAVIDFLYSFYTDESDGRLCLTYRGRLADGAAAEQASCRFVDLTDSLWASLRSDVEVVVLKRYRVEREVQRFGIYSGTLERGNVATIHEVRPDLPPTAPQGADPKEGT